MKKRLVVVLGAALSLTMCTAIPAFASEATASRGTVTASSLNVRAGASTSNRIVGGLDEGDKVTIVGKNNGWYKIRYDGSTAYVAGNYVSTSGSSSSSSSASTRSSSWNGAVLNRTNGTITGPSGKETYYNMDMSNIVRIMRARGNKGKYWVRKDGVKMLGNYVMVAANLNTHPRGSLVATSLGTGIVCDTGGFAAHNPNQLDIAVTW